MIKEILFIIISTLITILMYNKFGNQPNAYWFGVLNLIIVMIIDRIFHTDIQIDIDDDDFDEF